MKLRSKREFSIALRYDIRILGFGVGSLGFFHVGYAVKLAAESLDERLVGVDLRFWCKMSVGMVSCSHGHLVP